MLGVLYGQYVCDPFDWLLVQVRAMLPYQWCIHTKCFVTLRWWKIAYHTIGTPMPSPSAIYQIWTQKSGLILGVFRMCWLTMVYRTTQINKSIKWHQALPCYCYYMVRILGRWYWEWTEGGQDDPMKPPIRFSNDTGHTTPCVLPIVYWGLHTKNHLYTFVQTQSLPSILKPMINVARYEKKSTTLYN